MKTLLALVAAALTLAGCSSTHRQGVSQNELPAAAQATLEQAARGGKVNSIIKVSETTHTDYQADVTANGAHWDVLIGEDGKLIYKKAK